MDKFILALNKMIENFHLISDIVPARDRDSSEIFFKYRQKHCWGISKAEKKDEYFVFFYPGIISTTTLSHYSIDDFERIDMRSFPSSNYKSEEALASYKALYDKLHRKVDGMEDVLDEIINDDIPF